jgi:hypothetical protein
LTVFHLKKTRTAAKQSNRARLRLAAQMTELGKRSWLLLLGVLAQTGGEVTLSRGTQETVNRAVSRGQLDFEMVEGAEPGEFIVRLLMTGAEDQAVAPIEPAPEVPIAD